MESFKAFRIYNENDKVGGVPRSQHLEERGSALKLIVWLMGSDREGAGHVA